MLLPITPIVLPLLVAVILAGAQRWLPARTAHVIALIAASGSAAASIALALQARAHPILYWLGGWTPRDGISLGIALAIDPLGAGLAALSGLLVVGALVFAGAWFDEAHGRFDVLILVFLAALCGFGLTGDLFNLFVFFELMSAAAFALTGFKSRERGPIQGALNFAVTNTIGAVLVLMGISLLYGRTGALNLAQIGRALHDRGGDALVTVAFTLTTCGFGIKAALAPFHFWLDDAHAVAPAPVSVIFSGVMVEAGLYAIARLWGAVFHAGLGPGEAAARSVLLGLGVLTALVGGVMCVAQRHLKRLLAFSTISHVGTMTVAVATFDPGAVGGAALYAVGHGFVKGALFLCVGALLHRLESVDELALQGRGRKLPFLGVLFAISGLALATLPPFGLATGEADMDEGIARAGHAWASAVFVASAVLTGATVLRAAGRIFLGLGPRDPDAPEVGGETTEPPETEGHHYEMPWTMRLPPIVMLALSLAAGLTPALRRAAHAGAAMMLDTAGYAAWVLDGHLPTPPALPEMEPLSQAALRSLIIAAGAMALAALMLFRDSIPEAVRAPFTRVWGTVRHLRALHSGRIGDYVAWLVVGVAVVGVLCTLPR